MAVKAKGQRLRGSQYVPDKNIVVPFWEQEFNYAGDKQNRETGVEGPSVDQTPINEETAKVRTIDLTGVQDAFLAIRFKNAARLRQIDLPRELLSLTLIPNSTIGTGAGNHPTSQQDFNIVTGSGGLNPRDTAESSAAVSYELRPVWRKVRRSNGPCFTCGLHGVTDIMEADILTALSGTDFFNTTVNAWPKFLEDEISVVLNSQQVSIRSSADTSATISVDSTVTVKMNAVAYGDEYSIQVGIGSKVVELPPCIHDTIDLSATEAQIATVTVEADTVAIMQGMSEIIPAITNEPGARTKVVTASASPTSITALSVKTIPNTGLYLYDYQITDVGYGVWEIIAIVIDISNYV